MRTDRPEVTFAIQPKRNSFKAWNSQEFLTLFLKKLHDNSVEKVGFVRDVAHQTEKLGKLELSLWR